MLGSLYSELSWEGKGLLRPWDHFLGGVGTGRSGEIGCPEWYYSSGQKASGLALGMDSCSNGSFDIGRAHTEGQKLLQL